MEYVQKFNFRKTFPSLSAVASIFFYFLRNLFLSKNVSIFHGDSRATMIDSTIKLADT